MLSTVRARLTYATVLSTLPILISSGVPRGDRNVEDGIYRSGCGRYRACAAVFASIACWSILSFGLAAPAAAATDSFSSTGSPQTFTVPAGVNSIHVVAIGGKGGNVIAPINGPGNGAGGVGGAGAKVSADLAVTPGQILQVYVGGNGQNSNILGTLATGGFNGGGDGLYPSSSPGTSSGAGGGGASDIRADATLASRLLVAAGGGGAGEVGNTPSGTAGNGGAAEADAPGSVGTPAYAGTATQGGAGGPGAGSGTLGRGGDGGQDCCYGGGGGGGGLYGGGGGANFYGQPGAGGSNFTDASASNTTSELDTTGTPSVTISYEGDVTAPDAPSSLEASPASPSSDNDPVISGNAEADSTVDLYSTSDCSGSPVATGSAAEFASPGLTVHVADDSTTTFYATATDAASNTSACSTDSVTYVEDSTAPTASIDTQPADPTNSTQADFTYSSDDNAAGFECKLDSGDYASCPADGTSYSGLSEGSHTFSVKATDAAQNTGDADSYTWTVVTTAPQTSVTSGPANPTRSNTASFTYDSSKPNSSFECRLDAGAFASCPVSGETYADLADGRHVFSVRATDQHGNTDQSPVGRSFIVDTTQPETTVKLVTAVTTGPQHAAHKRRVKFKFHAKFPADEPGATFECALKGPDGADGPRSDFAPCESPKRYRGLEPGRYKFRVRAIDAAGNVDPTPAEYEFKLLG